MLLVERLLIRCSDGTPFDEEAYLARNPDVREAGLAPLDHYLRWGWAEGRDARLDLPERTHRAQAGLDRRPISALAHHLAHRSTHRAEPLPPPDLPTIEEIQARFDALAPVSSDNPEIDIIVPVYRGRLETLNCLLRVLEAQNETPANVLVVDDHGPDRALRADIARLARRGLVERLVQPRNKGFVAAINAGMARHPDRDVIWLNSDTEVFGDWIDRLRRVAYADKRIATVTPLTNNGTIASYPRFDRDNPDRPDCGWEALDQLAAEANGTAAVDTPTCVGFCTYVRRDAISAVGALDRATFGRGYGEENDFSRRAASRGWRNVIAGGVFVRHIGATSFGPERSGRIDHAMRAMAEKHPDYPRLIRDYAAGDPPAPLRQALDLARLRDGLDAAPTLIITHQRGGGTARFVDEEIARLRQTGRGALLMTGGATPGTVRLSRAGVDALPSLEAIPLKASTLAPLLRDLGVADLQVHHLVEFPRETPETLIWLADSLNLALDVAIHDYFAICPRINLAGLSGRYCGEPSEGTCRRCLTTRRSPAGAPDIIEWRRLHGRLLEAARLVRVPDDDVASRLLRYFPDLKRISVHPHETVSRQLKEHRPAEGSLRIAVLGAIGPIKGFDVLIRMAREVTRRCRPVEITVIGYTRNDIAARAAGLHVTGRYAEADMQALIEAQAPDIIFIPSTWPETFCYTLTHALNSGLPVAAFDLGAQAGRLRALGEGRAVLPLELSDRPGELLDRLEALAREDVSERTERAILQAV